MQIAIARGMVLASLIGIMALLGASVLQEIRLALFGLVLVPVFPIWVHWVSRSSSGGSLEPWMADYSPCEG